MPLVRVTDEAVVWQPSSSIGLPEISLATDLTFDQLDAINGLDLSARDLGTLRTLVATISPELLPHVGSLRLKDTSEMVKTWATKFHDAQGASLGEASPSPDIASNIGALSNTTGDTSSDSQPAESE